MIGRTYQGNLFHADDYLGYSARAGGPPERTVRQIGFGSKLPGVRRVFAFEIAFEEDRGLEVIVPGVRDLRPGDIYHTDDPVRFDPAPLQMIYRLHRETWSAQWGEPMPDRPRYIYRLDSEILAELAGI